MSSNRILCAALLVTTALTPCVAMTRARRGPTAHTKRSKSSTPAKRTSGQRSIDDARATQIQTALVRSGYMTEPSGHWDAATESAMQKYQSDNGWQTKLMPDSRAIIKLGLGPSQTTSQSDGSIAKAAEANVGESNSN
ncbi:MAG TPA: peptidoglycan-binding protein [Edaphobacter sp.]